MATAIAIIMVIMVMFVVIAIQETSSRLAWSFARDEGIIFSKYMQRIHPKLDVPIFALLFTWLLVFICGLIYLGSSTGKSVIMIYIHLHLRQQISEAN